MLIDGQPADAVPADDRGLAYGDGLFETLYWDGARCPLWDRHLARMAEGAARLGIPMPAAGIWQADLRTAAPPAGRAVIKLMLTRGSGPRGYRPPQPATPRRLLSIAAYADTAGSLSASGVRLRRCTTRLALDPLLAGIKHLNRLPQVLARAEWSDDGIAEGLLLDRDERVVGGTHTNLFAVCDDRLVTPRLAQAGVAGIARGLLLEAGLAVEVEMTERLFATAREAFLTNAVIGLWPVREYEGRALHTGTHTARARAVLAAAGLPC